MARIYFTPTDELKERPFEVKVPAYYHPFIPHEFSGAMQQTRPQVNRFKMTPMRQRNPTPFYQPLDHHQTQWASYPLEVLIDMRFRDVWFELVHDSDIVDIMELVDRYLLSIYDYVCQGSEDVVAYALQVVAFRHEAYKIYYRVLTLNPTLKEKLYPNESLTKNIFALSAKLTLGENKPGFEDPLKAKARPPYDIDAVIPRKATKPKDELETLEKALGIAKPKTVGQGDDDFDFGKFLQGR